MKKLKRGLALVLIAALLITTCLTSLPHMSEEVHADNPVKKIMLVNNGVADWIQGAQVSNVYFGHYQQSSDGSGGYSDEPIKWRVLDNDNVNKQLFLLSDKNLDCKEYNEIMTVITWEDCTLRTWLNGNGNEQFYHDAFLSKEQGAIKLTAVLNNDNPNYGTSGGNDTED